MHVVSCFDWIANAHKSENMPPIAHHLVLYLSSYMNASRNEAWPSIETIHKHTQISKRAIYKYLSWLENNGWLYREHAAITARTKGGNQKQNIYHPLIPSKGMHHMQPLSKGDAPRAQRGCTTCAKGMHHVQGNNNRITNNNKSEISKNPTPTVSEIAEFAKSNNITINPAALWRDWYSSGNKPPDDWKSDLLHSTPEQNHEH